MSKRIFELRKVNPGVIMNRMEGCYMQNDDGYVKQLEELIVKMVPIYNRYHEITGHKKPPLELSIIRKLTKKQPALFKPWPID